ncbi:multicopper oxidase family protein [Methylocystis parvus]|uniref:Multicopper oxidase family protein n=1 Tax=Methylocystis parvus TaxID=134 RepID=A0A6B8MB29_9HYPH|nr:multicopper oxidase family protein [Methylocystis parvus]QGM97860.1 multicopper oxidase family protein [Methylocystis parvus]WBK01831.1 multicopper oxidase family protein [Methylocystis parvus OBBP]
MKAGFDLTRRKVLLSAAATLAAPAFTRAAGMMTAPPRGATENFNPDVDVELVCKRDAVNILDGAPTQVWRYAGNLLKGPANTLTALPGSYLGPLMRFAKGQKIRIRLRNDLPEPTIAHWHGLHVPMEADGHPKAAIDPGQTYVYEFEMRNRAGFYLYHPHTHEATATQVYHGLAGGIVVEDEEERALGLPSGEYEIPIVLQDRSFDDNNQLAYWGGMHRDMFGFYGERILVNGRPDYGLDVASRAYRFRVLNASNARIYKLRWDDGTPLTVIGVDGGLLERPQTRPYAMLSPGERLDLWVDFSGRKTGSKLVMRSGAFDGLTPPMAQRMGGGRLLVGDDYPLFSVTVARETNDSPKLPEKLSTLRHYRRADVANPDNPRPIALSMGHMQLAINGRAYGHDEVMDIERIPVDTVQLFEIFHDHGGGGMGGGMGMMGTMDMAHPIHLHGEQFEILERRYSGDDPGSYATFQEGLIDSGLKDTVLVAPGERVLIAKPFNDFKGRFMYHCHNLEHEDMGMMREFSVE